MSRIGKKAIIRLAKEAVEAYEERDARLDAVEDYYWETGVSASEDGIYRVQVPDAKNAVDLIADMLGKQEISVTVPAKSDTQKDKRAADKVEKWLKAWLKVSEQTETVNLVRETAFDIVTTGAVVIRAMMLAERINAGENEGEGTDWEGGFPLVPEVRSWRYVYPVFSRSRITAVLERYEIKVADLRREWPEINLPRNWRDKDDVMMWEYWDSETKAFWSEGAKYSSVTGEVSTVKWLMPPTAHELGCFPYVIQFFRPSSKERGKPERLSPSLLESWAGIIEPLNLIESAKMTAALQYVNAAWVMKSDATEPADISLEPGYVNFLRTDEDLAPLVKAQMPLDLQQVANEWTQRFQRGSVPVALYGENIGSNMAGYAIALLSESGRRILIPVQDAITRALEQLCVKALRICMNLLGETAREYGRNLDISIIEDAEDNVRVMKKYPLDYTAIKGYRVEVHLSNPLPRDEERAANMALALRQPNVNGVPMLSDETLRERYLHVESDEEERLRIYAERLETKAAALLEGEMAQESGVAPKPGMPPVNPQTALAEAQGGNGAAAPAPGAPGGLPPELLDAVKGLMERVQALEKEVAMQKAAPVAAPAPVAPPTAPEPPAVPPAILDIMKGQMPPGASGAGEQPTPPRPPAGIAGAPEVG